MSGLRLKETFNRLLKDQYVQFLNKGAAACALAVSIALPAAAHHDENQELDVYDSGTAHSQELQSIQDRFNRAVGDRLIVLVDRDWVQINEALNNLPPGDTDLRQRYLVEYMVQRGQLHVPQEMFKNIDDDSLYSNPHSQTFNLTAQNNLRLRVCTVYGGRGEMDGRTAVRDFISPSAAIHGDDIADAPVQSAPDAKQYKQFVTYHEIGHCMDDWFVTAMATAKTPDDQLAYYHRAETFADVFSALMMAREEGVTDIAETIANIRLANAALAGPYRAIWADQGTKSFYASVIYATHRPVRAAQDYIDQNGPQTLQAMSYKDVALLARDLVDQNALSALETEVLVDLFAAKFDLDVWEQVKGDVPYIAQRYPYAVKLKQEMEQALRAVLDLGHIPAAQSVLEQISFAGNPYQRAAELEAQQNPVADSMRARALAAALLAEAGGQNATIKDLTRAFIRNKDLWRETLSGGTDAERRQAVENLAVAGQALREAARQVHGVTPSNDNGLLFVEQKAGSSGMAPS